MSSTGKDAAADAVAQAQALVAGGGLTATLPSLSDAIALVGTVAGAVANVVAPGASIAGMTVAQAIGLGIGVAREVPEAIEAVSMIKQLVESGGEPSPEQWAQINAAADAAHAEAQAAADAVINGDQASGS